MKITPLFNIFCRDVDRQMRFYQSIIGWRDVPEWSSPIYRVLERDGTQIGFNDFKAYELLGLSDRKPAAGRGSDVTTMLTFMVDDRTVVDEVAKKIPQLGGQLVQGPFPTYYGHWQLVFLDPEGNVARVSATSLPPGVTAPVVDFSD